MPRKGENIYKRKDGRWEGRYIRTYEGNRAKYGYVYGKSYSDVKKELIEKKAGAGIGKGRNELQDDLFTNISDLWLDSCRNVCKESTIIKYKNLLEYYIKPYMGNTRISTINTHMITDMLFELACCGGRKSVGLSVKTISDISSIMRRIRKFALAENFCLDFEIEEIRLRKEPRELRIFDRKEQSLLCDFLIENKCLCHAGMLICLYTGIRIGELCALKWDDISLEKKTLHIQKTMLRIQTDDGEQKTKIVITPPKSPCSVRTIPVQDMLVAYLARFEKGPDAYLLTGSAEKYVEPRTMQNRFKSVLKKCGIHSANFHALRHTFATRCVEAGFDTKSLSEILGHSSVNITLNRYVHPTMELKRSNMNKLCEFLTVR